MRKLALVLVCVLTWGMFTPPTDGRDDAGSSALEDAMTLLDRLDAVKVTVRFDDETLVRVIDRLDRESPVTVRADWEALDRLAIDEGSEVRLRVDAARLTTILGAIAIQLGDDFERPRFEVHAGQVVLTTVAGTETMSLTDAYDVRDLLADGETLTRMREESRAPEDLASHAAADPATDTPADPATDTTADDSKSTTDGGGPNLLGPDVNELASKLTPPRPRSPAAELMKLVIDHVDPDGWQDYGGTTASISERNGVFIVTAPPTTHRNLRGVLRRLRRAHPTGVSIEAAIVEIPHSAFIRLSRRLDPSSAVLARSVMGDDEASVHWRTTSAVAIDKDYSVESHAGGRSTNLDLRPSFDRDRGQLTVAVDLSSERNDDRRIVTTTVPIPYRRGGAVIELPGASQDESRWFLVLIPSRY